MAAIAPHPLLYRHVIDVKAKVAGSGTAQPLLGPKGLQPLDANDCHLLAGLNESVRRPLSYETEGSCKLGASSFPQLLVDLRAT